MTYCTVCGGYAGDESWRKYCKVCFRQQKAHEEKARVDEAFAAGYRSGFADGSAGGKKGAPEMDNRLIIDAVKLTHPDKHPPERFKLANDVTARLLRMKD